MGIIQRQSIKGVTVFVIGAAIHFFIMLVLMPNILSESDIAVFRVYFSVISIFTVLGLGGINTVTIRHWHEFEKDAERLKVFNLMTLISIVSFICISILFLYIGKYAIYAFKQTNNPYLLKYFLCVPVSIFFFGLIYYFEAYSIATHRLTAPSFVKEIIMKCILLMAIAAYYFKWITIYQFFIGYALSYFVGFLIIMLYCVFIRGYRIGYDKTILRSLNFKSYLPYAFFIFLIAAIGALNINTDQIVVYGMLGSKPTDIYGHAVTAAAMITIPYKPLSAILLPFTYEAWHKNDFEKLNQINSQSARYLSAIGSLLFIVLVANADNLIHLAPHFSAFKWPLIIIGLGRVLDYTTGISTELVLASPSHKKLILYIALTFLFSLLCYKIFIPWLHEIGAAISCSLTLIFFNILKFYHLKRTYHLQPIAKESILLIVIGLSILGLQFLLPVLSNFIFDAFYRSALVACIYVLLVYRTKFLPEMNEFVNGLLFKVKGA